MNETLRSRALNLLSTFPAAVQISERLMRRHHPIFMFHRILPANRPCYDAEMTTTPEVLDAFLGWLSDHYAVVPLPALAGADPGDRADGKPLCAVTFDDGWIDNYEHAFPILTKHAIPATIFVATGFVGTTRRFWQDRLWHAVGAAHPNFDPHDVAEKLWGHFPWCPRLSASDISVAGIRRILMQCGSSDAEEFVSRLEDVTGLKPVTETTFLNWDQIQEMQQHGIAFGAHTHNHARLTAISPAAAYDEIDRSKRELELHLGRPVESFSYPWGKTMSHITQHVAAAGFTCAVKAEVAAGRGTEDPFLMSRIPVSGQVLARDTGTFKPAQAGISFAVSQLRAKKQARKQDVPSVQRPFPEGPLRLALMIDAIDSWSGGGTEGHIQNLLNALDRRYFQPELFLLDPSALKPEDIPCPVHVVRPGSGPRAIRSVRELTRSLKKFKPHIVQTFFPDSTLFGTIAAHRANVPIVIHSERNLAHDLSRRDRLVRTWLRGKATGFQCNSRAIESMVKRDVAQHRIEILHNHLNTDYYSPADAGARASARLQLGFAANTPLFVLVANLRRVKDLATCIRAAALTRVTIPGVRFVIIGEGELRGELQQQIHQLDLQDHVQLAGMQEDVRPWLAAADIGILTSTSEGSSNAVLEYMAAALPAVLSDIPANRELVDGVFFKTGDAGDLATQLHLLWKSREKRKALGQEYCERALHYGTTMFRERAQAYYVRLASRYEEALS